MTDTPLLRLPFIEAAQSQKHVTHNESLALLDALAQLSVLQAGVVAPPASPSNGERFLVGANPTGEFAGHVNEIASWQDNAWRILPPRAGWRLYVEDSRAFLVFDGALWQDISASVRQLQNLERLGIGAQADAQNPFAAKLNNALLTARYAGDGGNGDLRAVFNKEAAAGVVSQLFQTGFSARAEAGLIGADDYSIKVSPDGAAWQEALRIDRNTGIVNFPAGLTGAPGLAVKRVEIFTASGTFVKQPGDALFHVELVGGGGGGGSGARNAPGSSCGGGSGGNGGSPVIAWVTADQLGASTPVAIGAGGAGGAPAANSSNGANGTPGGNTNFGSILSASGGREGYSGKTTSGGGASNHLPGYPDNDYARSGAGGFAAAGGIPSRSGVATSAAGLSGPGGGGGGLSSANTSFAGGAGSSAGYAWLSYRGSIPAGGAAEGGAGAAGNSVSDPRGMFGGGGAGGGAAHATAAGNGGDGGSFGAGGGGGGAGRNGFSGGAGGNGAPGKAIIVVFG